MVSCKRGRHDIYNKSDINYITNLNGCGEAARVLGGSHNQRIDVRLSQILKVQFLGQFDYTRGGSNVEGTRALSLRLQRITYLTVRKGLGLNRNDAEKRERMGGSV